MSKLEARISRLYSDARAFVEHEDDLVDRRLKWVITVNGFLFAVVGATWIAWPGVLNESTEEIAPLLVLSFVRISVSVCGYLNAYVGAISIEAAHLAIRAVTRKYNTFLLYNRREISDSDIQVWKLIGDRSTHNPGFWSSTITPIAIAGVWLLLIIVEACVIFYFSGFHSETKALGLVLVLAVLPIVVFFAAAKLIDFLSMNKKKMEYSKFRSWEIHKSGRFISKRSSVWISESSFRKRISNPNCAANNTRDID